MMMFHVPTDRELLAAFGEVSLRHEQLNHILRMTIKTLADLQIAEALDATAYDSSSRLRERIKKLTRQRLGDGTTLLRVEALLRRCERVTEERNTLIHSVWAQELDGVPVRLSGNDSPMPLPTVAGLRSLAAEIEAITLALNEARLEGFISEALEKSPH